MANREETWRARQAQAAAQPLELCPQFPEIAARWERWWAFDAERPLLAGSIAKDRRHPALARGKAFDLLDDPQAWLAVREAQVTATYWIDAAVPSLRADIGPVCIGAFLGAPLTISNAEQTTWQTPILTGHDWDGEVPALDEDAFWLRRTLELAARTAEAGAGRYLTCLPDLSGAVDILANLRGTETLLMDLHDRPAAVERAALALNDAWARVQALFYETITAAGSGVTTWLCAWSAAPYALPTNDFNVMISPAQFGRFCLPSLVDQGRRAGRVGLHMDGPGAVAHLQALAETPEITAVQFTPGAATPSALAWIDSWQMLQEAGKPLALACPADEVDELCRRLDRRGLLLLVQGVGSVQEAQALEARVGARPQVDG